MIKKYGVQDILPRLFEELGDAATEEVCGWRDGARCPYTTRALKGGRGFVGLSQGDSNPDEVSLIVLSSLKPEPRLWGHLCVRLSRNLYMFGPGPHRQWGLQTNDNCKDSSLQLAKIIRGLFKQARELEIAPECNRPMLREE